MKKAPEAMEQAAGCVKQRAQAAQFQGLEVSDNEEVRAIINKFIEKFWEAKNIEMQSYNMF